MKTLAATLTALAFVHAAPATLAQTTEPATGFPNKPLRVVVPFTAGSATDAVARLVTERLGAQWGQTMVVPAKTPSGIIAKIHQSTVTTLQAPDTTERMARLGAEQMIMTPREFDAHIKTEIGINATLVKAAKINVN